MQLRPRQAEFVARGLAELETEDNICGVAPTGAGKTIMLSALAGQYLAQQGGRVLVLQHRDELTDQNAKKFRRFNPHITTSLVDATAKHWHGQAIFGMVPTLARPSNLLRIPADISLAIVDECHHATAESYRRIIKAIREANARAKILGVTATPNRGDGKPLRTVFNSVFDQITIGELIASGHLVRPRTFVIDVGVTEELRGVRRVAADFDMGQVAKIMDKSVVTDAVVAKWRDGDPDKGVPSCADRQTVVFCSTVEHARHVCGSFRAAGVSAETIHGDMAKTERRSILERFKRFEIQVLVNVAVLTEGFDHPPVSCVILLRPSSYKSTLTQMIGRGLRVLDPTEWPGLVKTDCVVLDFGTACLTHGCLEEEAALDGHQGSGEAPKKDCPECDARVPISVMECPLCGFQWEREEKERSDLRDFQLTEIDLLRRSDFKWIDIWGDDQALMATGLNSWAGIFQWADAWHAVGHADKALRHLGVGDKAVALAHGDDFLNETEDSSARRRTNRWVKAPATAGQLQALGQQVGIGLDLTQYRAACLLNWKFNKSRVQGLVQHFARNRSEAA